MIVFMGLGWASGLGEAGLGTILVVEWMLQ